MGSSFSVFCLLHSAIAVTCGALMLFYLYEISVFGYGSETASNQTAESFSGLLLFGIGFVLFMVSFVKDREFQSFFAKGCILLHALMAFWRVYFERRLEGLARDWSRQVVGDLILGVSWVLILDPDQ
ncbi:hypothetical protein AMTRI_Chr07g25720 [Amborella trichopoda]